MTNPFTKTTITDYNANPPPDDGSQTAANQVNWSKTKTKIGDPLKAGFDGSETNTDEAFADYLFHASDAISANETLALANERRIASCSNTITVTLLDVATAGAGFLQPVKNTGTGTVTLDGDGTETIDDALTIDLFPNDSVLLFCNATSWDIVADGRATFVNGADVASATALSLGDGTNFDVTGTTTITSIDTKRVGEVVSLQFDGILTLTHDSADLVLPGAANITTAAGDIAIMHEYASGDWRCISYQKSDGAPLVSSGLIGFQVFTASGTWTPTLGTNAVVVELRAAGGGGGGSNTSGETGGAGGEGGRSIERITSGLGATETVTIGAGGTAGASSGGTGGTGGTTSFGAFLSATGGAGGVGALTGGTTHAGGSGGAGSGGDINFTGQSGGPGDGAVGGTGGGEGGGKGGHATSFVGEDGRNGGGGGGANDGNRAGGAGGAGWVMIWEYS